MYRKKRAWNKVWIWKTQLSKMLSNLIFRADLPLTIVSLVLLGAKYISPYKSICTKHGELVCRLNLSSLRLLCVLFFSLLFFYSQCHCSKVGHLFSWLLLVFGKWFSSFFFFDIFYIFCWVITNQTEYFYIWISPRDKCVEIF